QLSKGEGLDGSRYGAVVHQRGLIAPAVLHVPIERVVARVDHPTWEPAVERGARAIEDAVPSLVPVDRVAGFGPKPFGVFDPLGVDVVLDALRGVDAGRGVHESPRGGVRDVGVEAAGRAPGCARAGSWHPAQNRTDSSRRPVSSGFQGQRIAPAG